MDSDGLSRFKFNNFSNNVPRVGSNSRPRIYKSASGITHLLSQGGVLFLLNPGRLYTIVTELPQILHHNRQVVWRIFLFWVLQAWLGSQVLKCDSFRRDFYEYCPHGGACAIFYKSGKAIYSRYNIDYLWICLNTD